MKWNRRNVGQLFTRLRRGKKGGMIRDLKRGQATRKGESQKPALIIHINVLSLSVVHGL